MTEEIQNLIRTTINDNDVVLFMKGTQQSPQCGFSSRVSSLLNYLEVKFSYVNVLDNQEVREGIKEFSDWPTIPQLYVKGEFIGGHDIVMEMMMSEELCTIFKEKNLAYNQEAATKIIETNK